MLLQSVGGPIVWRKKMKEAMVIENDVLIRLRKHPTSSSKHPILSSKVRGRQSSKSVIERRDV